MWSASSSAGGRVCGVTASSCSVGPIVSASRTTIQPAGVFHVVTSTFVPGLVHARGRVVDAERRRTGRSPPRGRAGCRRRSASRRRARRASRSRRRARRARPCGSSRGTRSPRSAGTATGRPRSAAPLGLVGRAHGVDPRPVPAAVACDQRVAASRAPRPGRVGVNGRRRVEQRLHDPPGLLDAVLPREARRLADHRRVEQHLVGRRALTALVARTPCRA